MALLFPNQALSMFNYRYHKEFFADWLVSGGMELAETKAVTPKAKNIVLVVLLLAGLAVALLVLRDSPSPGSAAEEAGRQSADKEDAQPGLTAVASADKTASEPATSPARQESKRMEVVRRFEWGDGPGQLGHKIPEDGAPEGPMSFIVDDSGRVVVLDQVNSRVQIFDADMKPAEIDLPADTYQDIATDADGNPVLLDRLARRSVEIYSPDGKLLQKTALVGPGVPEGGGVTGLFHRPDGIWVEVEHTRLVRIADAQGRPDTERPVMPGRFSKDGRLILTAARSGQKSADLMSWPMADHGSAPVLLARLQFDTRLAAINALESDTNGRIFIGALLVNERPGPPHDVVSANEEIVMLAADGRLIDRLRLPVNNGPEEQFRPIRLGRDGKLYRLRCTGDGAILERWTP